ISLSLSGIGLAIFGVGVFRLAHGAGFWLALLGRRGRRRQRILGGAVELGERVFLVFERFGYVALFQGIGGFGCCLGGVGQLHIRGLLGDVGLQLSKIRLLLALALQLLHLVLLHFFACQFFRFLGLGGRLLGFFERLRELLSRGL